MLIETLQRKKSNHQVETKDGLRNSLIHDIVYFLIIDAQILTRLNVKDEMLYPDNQGNCQTEGLDFVYKHLLK